MFIALSGLIGVGKTTLCDALSKVMNLPCFHEPVETNPFLADFYDESKRKGVAFPMEVFLFVRRFEMQREIVYSTTGGVQDRSLYEDLCFVEILHDTGVFSDAEYKTYQDMYETFLKDLPHPDLIVHLDCSPQTALDRIHLRDRKCEKQMPLAYLELLHAAYEKGIARIGKDIPILRVPCDAEFADPVAIAEQIKVAIERRTCVQRL